MIMTRYSAYIAVFGFCTGIFAADIVKNGDFETNENWDAPKKTQCFSYETENVKSGKRCMKVLKHAYQGGIRFEKDKSYKLAVSVKCKDVPENGFCVKILKFKNGKPAGWVSKYGVYQLIRSGGTHDWKNFSTTITPEMTGGETKCFLFVSQEKKGGEVWVDDVSLTEVPTPKVVYRDLPNLWPYDGSFETGTDLFTAKQDSSTAHDGKYSLRIEPGKKLVSFRAFLLKKANHIGCLSFYVKADRPCKIDVFTHDDWWSWNGRQSFSIGTDWTRCIVYQKAQKTTASVSFTITPKNPKAVLWLDSLSYTLDFPAPKYTPARQFDVGSSMPESGGILMISKDPVIHTIAARNNTDREGVFHFRAELENASVSGKKTVFEKTITLKKGELFETKATVLSESKRGYYVLRTTLLQEGKAVASHAQPFCIVDQPREVRKDSFFGIHFEKGDQTRKLGASWTRNFQNWYESPDKNGKFRVSGKAVAALSEKINQFWCINTNRGPGSVKVKGKIPYETLLTWVKAVLGSYQGKVPAIEFMNEPDLAYSNKPEEYAKLLNKLIPEARKIAPDVKFGGGGVSGVDFNQDFLYTEKVIAIAGKNLDIVPVHPYTYNHYVDASDSDIWPEAAKTYERAFKLRELLKKHGSKAEVWYGEVGWAPDVTEDYLSEANRRSASYIPRLFILSKAAGVKRVFYFLIEVCLERERYNYGLFRSNKPLPGASAYAAAAQAIEFAKTSKVIANQDYHAFTFKREDGRMLACLWMSNREKTKITLNLPKGSEVRDMFWNPVTLKNNAWDLSGEMSYVLVSGMSEDDFNKLIAGAKVEMPPLKAIWKLSGGNAVDLTLSNLRTAPQKGTVTLTGADFKSNTRKFDLPPSGTQVFRFSSASFLSGKTIQLSARSDSGDFKSQFRPHIVDCPFWSEQEFRAEALPKTGRMPVMDSRNYLLPNDPTNGWDGPQNLSVESAVGHDKKNLYLRIDVRDDIHHQTRKSGMLWAADSIQLAIDSKGNASGMGYDKDDYEFGFGLTKKGPEKELTYTYDTGRFKSILAGADVKISRVGNITRYWIAIPWYVLKIDPAPGTVFGMNFTANDSDGASVRFWMGVTPGIVDSKNPGAYRKFLIR